MRIAILSDIHGNLEALQAVATDLGHQQVGKIVCLGDQIGYGPDPDEVVEAIQQLGCVAIMGNHEAAIADHRQRNKMNFQASENSEATEKLLSPESLKFCCGLPVWYVHDEGYFVHGFPPASVNSYLYSLSDSRIETVLEEGLGDLFFVGHTHLLKLVSCQRDGLVKSDLPVGETMLLPGIKYVVNAGSVGQPRDGDNRAKYLIWDTKQKKIEVRAVPYDVESTIQKIQQRGFPPFYGSRLR